MEHLGAFSAGIFPSLGHPAAQNKQSRPRNPTLNGHSRATLPGRERFGWLQEPGVGISLMDIGMAVSAAVARVLVWNARGTQVSLTCMSLENPRHPTATQARSPQLSTG